MSGPSTVILLSLALVVSVAILTERRRGRWAAAQWLYLRLGWLYPGGFVAGSTGEGSIPPAAWQALAAAYAVPWVAAWARLAWLTSQAPPDTRHPV